MFTKPLRVAIGCFLISLFLFNAMNAYAAANVDSKPTTARSIAGLERIQSLAPLQDGSVLGLDPVTIYGSSNRSVVTVQGARLVKTLSLFGVQNSVESVIGSGFVIKYLNSYYVVTNFHVVDSLVNVTVTFWNGDAYAATVIGSDPYSDIGVLSTKGGEEDPVPLAFDSSSLVRVGQPVMAIGNPYGLSGSVTLGIVSQVGRTIQYQSTTGSYLVADAIQFSAPINPGNSGGPLLDANGGVVGVTSAAVTGSQGVGFAIPSDTITRELPFLITAGKYDRHPYLGVRGTDMNYLLAQAMGINITYGVLIERVAPGGPAEKAGLKVGQRTVTIGQDQYQVGGDVIVSMNGVRIVNFDAFAAYIEEHLTPGDTVQVGIIRSGAFTVVEVTVAARPSQ